MKRSALTLCILLSGAACARSHGRSATGDHATVHAMAGRPARESGTQSDASTGRPEREPATGEDGAATTSTTQPPATAGSTAPERREVWIGELRTEYAWLADGWNPSPVKVATETPVTERVALMIDRDPSGVTGSIVFGDEDPPRVQSEVPSMLRAQVTTDTREYPLNGFEYTLLEPRLTATRLHFGIAPFEVWRAECEHGGLTCRERGRCAVGKPDPTCDCKAGVCTLDLSYRVMVSLSIEPDRIEGVVSDSSVGPPPEIRLRRVQ